MTPSPYILPGLKPVAVTIERIIDVVASFYGVNPDDLETNNRSREVCEPRQVCMSLIRHRTPLSLKRIGRMFQKDHATVLHAEKAVGNLLQTNKEFRLKFISICHNLGIDESEINKLVK